MKTKELKKKYLEFFKKKKHAIIKSASLMPEHDPTVLFTTAGMHPLVPYLIGQPHPQGKRLANVQKCIRTGDIDEVGNTTHLTFFEMLGNWSLGDYFKKQAIEWSFEFLTKVLKLDASKLHITVFAGDKNASKDEESAKIWRGLGIPDKRIYYLPKSDNWWGPAGKTGPCGPCTEIFIDTGKRKCSPECKPGCHCGKYFEIWNDVFMEYNKVGENKYKKLKQKNVDTGMGVERTAAMLQGKDNVYEIAVFKPIIDEIKKLAKLDNFSHEQTRSIRIIADHMKAAAFILGEGIVPSNLDQGYILRRFVRRSIRHGKLLGIEGDLCRPIANIVVKLYKDDYPELNKNKKFIMDELLKEEERFRKTLEKGLREFGRMVRIINAHMSALAQPAKRMSKAIEKALLPAKKTFLLFQSYGFPIEMIEELAKEKGIKVDKKGFEKEFKKHQEISRKGAEKRFKGGLADSGEETTKLHTATHLLNQALREVLGKKDILQKGSNITSERLRFDFNFDRKLTKEELKKVEDWVNKSIKQGLTVKRQEMTIEQAKKKGAQGAFEAKYGKKVFVYSIGKKSIEICGGPHVKNTKELGHFRIKKEESSAAGIRRIKAVLE